MGESIEVSIDNQGGILLPLELRERLGLAPGMTMIVEEDEHDNLCLRVQTEKPELLDKEGIIVVKAKATGDVTNSTRRERDRRLIELLKRTGL